MKIPENKIKSLRTMLYAKIKEGSDIRLTITAYKQGEERGLKIAEKADIKSLININNILELEKFVRAKIEVFDFKKDENKAERTHEYTDETVGFSGFGDVEDAEEKRINKIVDTRMREQDYERLKSDYKELEDYVGEVETELKEAKEAIEVFKEKIKSQQNWKTYAGIAGVAFNKMGLKDELKGVLSGFTDDDEGDENSTKSIESDNTGIVEHPHYSSQPNPKNEFIDLIAMCLQSMDSTMLGVVFSIFSEIEQNNTLGLQILTLIQKHKNANQQHQQNLQTQQNLKNDENTN